LRGGLEQSANFGRKFKTIGIDISEKKIIRLKKRKDENNQCTVNEFKKSKNISFSSNYKSVKDSDIVIVCLPTPVYANNKPDLSILTNASKEIGKYLKNYSIIK
jgi:UDP-N-acetyl-D-galactosamine dehydrogenase